MTSKKVKLNWILLGLLSLIAGIEPLKVGLTIPLIGLVGIFISYAKKQIDYYFYLITLIAAFWGPYLALPQIHSLFLFRIMLPIHLLLFMMNKRKKSINSEFKYVLIGLSIWLLFSIITLFWSDYPMNSLSSLYFNFEITYFIVFSIYYFDDLSKIKNVAIILTVNYFLIMLYSLIGEYILQIHLIFSAAYKSGYDTRPTGMFVNTNDFAAFISMYFSIFLLTIKRENNTKNVKSKILVVLVSIVSLLLIIQTNSRSGFIAFLLILLLLFLKYMKIQNILIMATISILCLIFKPSGSKLININVLMTRVELTFLGKMNSTAERMKIYKYALNSISDNPFGRGVGSSQKHVFYLLNGYMNLPPISNQNMGMHNFLLAIIFDTGFFGLLGMMIILIYMFFQSIKMFIINRNYIFIYPLLSLISFIAVSIGSSSIFEMRTVWISFGLTLAVILNRKRISEEI